MTGNRRAIGLSAVLLALAALALWASSRMTWVRVTSFDGLGEQQTTSLVGGTWAAATTPLAIAAIAAVAALFAVRGRWSYLLAALIALVSVGGAVPAVQLLVSGAESERAAALAELPDRAEVIDTEVLRAPAALALVGSVAALVAAYLVVRSKTTRTGLSTKYDSPAVRKERAEREVAATSVDDEDISERALWDALDSGVDPTAPRERSGESEPRSP